MKIDNNSSMIPLDGKNKIDAIGILFDTVKTSIATILSVMAIQDDAPLIADILLVMTTTVNAVVLALRTQGEKEPLDMLRPLADTINALVASGVLMMGIEGRLDSNPHQDLYKGLGISSILLSLKGTFVTVKTVLEVAYDEFLDRK